MTDPKPGPDSEKLPPPGQFEYPPLTEPYPLGVGNAPWSDGKRRVPPTKPGEYPHGVE